MNSEYYAKLTPQLPKDKYRFGYGFSLARCMTVSNDRQTHTA